MDSEENKKSKSEKTNGWRWRQFNKWDVQKQLLTTHPKRTDVQPVSEQTPWKAKHPAFRSPAFSVLLFRDHCCVVYQQTASCEIISILKGNSTHLEITVSLLSAFQELWISNRKAWYDLGSLVSWSSESVCLETQNPVLLLSDLLSARVPGLHPSLKVFTTWMPGISGKSCSRKKQQKGPLVLT